jgi:branched-chain amino acid transport system permease protein
MDFLFTVLVFIAIYVVLAVSFDLVIGYTGLFSVAHAAFFAIGAYTTAIVAVRLDLPIVLAAILGALMCAASSNILALLAIRVSQDYLVIASFGFLTVVLSALVNLPSITGGTLGIGNIPPPELLGLRVAGPASYALAYLPLAGIVVALTWWLARSPFGRALRAIRENVVGAEALGKTPIYFKIWAFTIAGGLAGVAGAMYAAYISYISPDAFSNDVNILLFAMVILGGAGTTFGPLLGAVLLTVLPAVLQLMPLPPTLVGPVEQIIYGGLLVVFMMTRADGLYGLLRAGIGRATGARI